MDELSTLLADAKSIIDQIQQLESGENAGNAENQPQPIPGEMPDQSMKAMDMPGELPAGGGEMNPDEMQKPPKMKPEDEGLMKGCGVKKEIMNQGKADGTTASDDADARLLDDQELDLKEIEVAKKLLKKGIISVNQRVDKNQQLITAVSALNRAVKSLTGFVSEHHSAIEGLIQGAGYADMIRKSYANEASRTVQKAGRPVMTSQDDSLEAIRKSIDDLQHQLVRKEEPAVNYDRGIEVRKSISQALPGIFGTGNRF